tara:strand:- start:252 stop:668 length:417 start_codon:yes stop_codon:yes gene_type:complete
MDVRRNIEGVAVSGRLECVGERQCVQLIQSHGVLSLSFTADAAIGDGIESHAGSVLDQLYHIASYAHDNQPMLRDILELVIRRIDAAQAHGSAGPVGDVIQHEIGRYFAQAFPMPVPEECWEQVLRMIAPARRGEDSA